MGRPLKDNILFFSHDADAWDNWKFRALRAHYPPIEKGWAMEARFWALNCMIADSNACRLELGRRGVELDVATKLGMSLDELREFIDFLANKESCDLLNRENGYVWTDRCEEELERVRKSRENDRKRKSGHIPDGKPSIPDGNNRNPDGKEAFPPGSQRNPPGELAFPGKQQTAADSSLADKSVQDSSNSNEISKLASPPPAAGLAPEAPPADAAAQEPPQPAEPVFSPAILRKHLSSAGIVLDDSKLSEVYGELPGNSFEARACVAYMLRKIEERKADKKDPLRKPTPYFLSVYKLWAVEWPSTKTPEEKTLTGSAPNPHAGEIGSREIEIERAKAERDKSHSDPASQQQIALEVAHLHLKMHKPLTESDTKALIAAGEPVPAPKGSPPPPAAAPVEQPEEPLFEPETPPVSPEPQVEFEDDLPWQTSQGKKPDLPEPAAQTAAAKKNEELEIF